jgi:hypothetical protein
MGVMSLAGSKAIFFMMLGPMVSGGLAANQIVSPSGAALDTRSPASVALAPGLFSTTTFWPSSRASAGANCRAAASTGPPAV